MDKNKILKYAAVFLLIIGIAYFWNKLAPGAIENDIKSDSSKTTETSPTIQLNELDKVTSDKQIPSIIKEYEGFTVNFNPENKTPNYVSWILQGNETAGSSSRSNNFWTDIELDGCPDTRDYSRSGYYRGHMCPAG